MTNRHTMLLTCAVAALPLAGPGTARASHLDVLVEQMDGQLVTGNADLENHQWTLGKRVFSYEFDSDYAVNYPGYNSLEAGSGYLPAGSDALPGNTALAWDFLPMTVDDAQQNLFYWDGSDTDGLAGITPDDVAFGPLPGPDYLLSLYDRSNGKHSVDGRDMTVPGGVIDETDSTGYLHKHLYYYLENGSGTPADGIYLFAMQLRMTGLETPLPIYMVFGTPGSSVEALDDAAIPWVEENVDVLILPALPGDYNGDGVVDAADYTVWRDNLGSSENLAADGDGSGTIDEGDFVVWKEHFGSVRQPAGALAASAVPEPTALALALVAAIGVQFGRRRLPVKARRARRQR